MPQSHYDVNEQQQKHRAVAKQIDDRKPGEVNSNLHGFFQESQWEQRALLEQQVGRHYPSNLWYSPISLEQSSGKSGILPQGDVIGSSAWLPSPIFDLIFSHVGRVVELSRGVDIPPVPAVNNE